MKVLIVGSGGVGESTTAIAKRRDPGGELFETMVLADYDLAKAQAASARMGDDKRFPAEQVDAADVDAVVALCAKHDADVLCSFLPVEFNPYTLQAALKARVHHLDASTTLSVPHPTDPFNQANVVLGEDRDRAERRVREDRQARAHGHRRRAGHGRLVLPLRRRPLLRRDRRDRRARRRQPRDPRLQGHQLRLLHLDDDRGVHQPAVVWERDRGFYTVPPLSDPEPFYLPEGIGWVDVAHVEHEEVLHVGWFQTCSRASRRRPSSTRWATSSSRRWRSSSRSNMHSLKPVSVRGKEVRPRDVIEAAAPTPTRSASGYVGQTCAGTWVRGRKEGLERQVYLYQVADNQESVASTARRAWWRRRRSRA